MLSSALEQREYEAILHVKESMQLVESAIMEKEQVLEGYSQVM